MMELKCIDCKEKVGEAEIKFIEQKGRRFKKLFLKNKLKGTIIRNKKKDPEKWEALCNKCQSKRSKE